ncbi:MAG TPA: polysaccharide pyruvyl transferase family protein, partial [Longilinea sp.]|nr:polysaccharide pyruvyl transferase family protein [Longilinea sp.]
SLFILGGGGIFYDYYGVDKNKLLTREQGGIPLYSGSTIIARLLNKPVMIYAAGAGPLLTADGKEMTRIAFDCADVIAVRDSGSKALITALGLAAEKIRVTTDPAYLLPEIPASAVEELQVKFKLKDAHPLVGVALREWDLANSPVDWVDIVREALDNFVDKYHATLVFIPFHATTAETSDTKFMHRFVNKMRNKKSAVILPEKLSAQEKSGLIGTCDLVLGMRLHSIIFSIKNEVPFVALEYDPKVTQALQDSKLSAYGVALDILTSAKLENLLENVYSHRSVIRKELSVEKGRLLQLAKVNNELAYSLLDHPDAYMRHAPAGEWLNAAAIQLIEQNDALWVLVGSLRDEITRKNNQFQKDIDSLTHLAEKQLAEINADKDEIYHLKAAVDQKEFDIGVLAKEISGLKTVVDQKSVEGSRLREETATLKQTIDSRIKEISSLKETLDKAFADHQLLVSSYNDLSKDLKWYREEVDRRQFLHKEAAPLRLIDKIFRGLVFWDRYGFRQLIRKIVGKRSGKSSTS